ncbi:transglutaminase-like domain-containing protein [Stieleria maiorica]|nr:transglutaminase domain-containing protein [Stieleria maiorica]
MILSSGLLATSGCKDLIPPRPPIGQPAAETEQIERGETAESETVAETDPSPQESFEGDWGAWYVHRFGSQVVGVTEIKADAVIDGIDFAAATEARYSRRERMIFRTGNASFVRRITLTSVESVDGALRSFSSDVHAGPISSSARGTRNQQKLTVTTTGEGGQKSNQLDWPAKTRGLFALEQTLRRRGIETGQTRRLSVLMPSLQSIGVIELRCTGAASVPMLSGSYRTLREVDVATFQDGQQVDSLVVWIDDQGVIEKSLHLGLRLESFRTDRVTAGDLFDQPDDGKVAFSVAGSLRRDADPTEVAYVVVDASRSQDRPESEAGSKADPAAAEFIPAVAGQSVRERGDGVHVLVSTQRKAPAGFQQDRSVVLPIDTAATEIIDTGHASVIRMAGAIGELPVGDLAQELARLVQNDLALIPQGDLRPASAIVRSGQGGAIDHAILITALLRARQIPARVVFGLSRSRTDGTSAGGPSAGDRLRMNLDAWVVASIDGEWISIDPISSRINRADQIGLSRPAGDADLSRELAKVFRRLAEIEIEIRGASYGAD